MIDIDHVDAIERAHTNHLQAENLGTVVRELQGGRRCPYCQSGFITRDLYYQHLRRANRSGLCLGEKAPRVE